MTARINICAECGYDDRCTDCCECTVCDLCDCVKCLECGESSTAEAIEAGELCCDGAERNARDDDHEATHDWRGEA